MELIELPVELRLKKLNKKEKIILNLPIEILEIILYQLTYRDFFAFIDCIKNILTKETKQVMNEIFNPLYNKLKQKYVISFHQIFEIYYNRQSRNFDGTNKMDILEKIKILDNNEIMKLLRFLHFRSNIILQNDIGNYDIENSLSIHRLHDYNAAITPLELYNQENPSFVIRFSLNKKERGKGIFLVIECGRNRSYEKIIN